MKKSRKSARAPSDEENHLVPISCPDCSGVLHLEEEGPKEFPLYICQIDHRYSTRSLMQGKEMQLERALWSAHVLLKQTMIVYEQTLARTKELSGQDRRSMQRRINEVRKQCLAIRAMIEATRVVE